MHRHYPPFSILVTQNRLIKSPSAKLFCAHAVPTVQGNLNKHPSRKCQASTCLGTESVTLSPGVSYARDLHHPIRWCGNSTTSPLPPTRNSRLPFTLQRCDSVTILVLPHSRGSLPFSTHAVKQTYSTTHSTRLRWIMDGGMFQCWLMWFLCGV